MTYVPSGSLDTAYVEWLMKHGATDDELRELDDVTAKIIRATVEKQWE